jgi:flagellar biosynthetic protein FliR
MIDDVLNRIPVFVLVVFRLAGVMLMTPVFSSPRTPKRVKALLVIVLAFGVSGGVRAVPLPDTTWELTIGIGGEMAFGAAMGMLVSFVFVAAQWAGEMIGIEMGLNMSQIFDPAMGHAGSLTGDVYYFLTLAVFLTINGHHALLNAVAASFDFLPLLSLGVDKPLLNTVVGMLQSATVLALRLAAPMLMTVLIVDLSLGLIGRAMPQFNVMQVGMSLRSLVGLVIVIVGLTLTTGILHQSLDHSLDHIRHMWTTPTAAPAG